MSATETARLAGSCREGSSFGCALAGRLFGLDSCTAHPVSHLLAGCKLIDAAFVVCCGRTEMVGAVSQGAALL